MRSEFQHDLSVDVVGDNMVLRYVKTRKDDSGELNEWGQRKLDFIVLERKDFYSWNAIPQYLIRSCIAYNKKCIVTLCLFSYGSRKFIPSDLWSQMSPNLIRNFFFNLELKSGTRKFYPQGDVFVKPTRQQKKQNIR